MTFNFYKHALENITGLRLHLETKQRHSYILRSISACFFQLKQLKACILFWDWI